MTQTAIPAVASEKDWQKTVLDLARLHGWHVAHFRPAMTSRGWRTPVEADGAGFPDLVLVRGERLIFAELKAEKGRLSPAQKGWLQKLAHVPQIEVHIWKPGEFDEVHAILRRS